MKILISPAKKMRVDTDSLPWETLPPFLPQAELIKETLQRSSPAQLQRLWCCNSAIAALNVERLQKMDLCKRLTPAILAYDGIQYRYMAPGIFEEKELSYIGSHLLILSGFYGLLRPFDGVVPHRLEMQARLQVDGCADLYSFWGDRLCREACRGSDLILNLASKEYARAVVPHLPGDVSLVSCTFGELAEGRVVEKGTLCKMARGEMVRHLARSNVTDLEGVKTFCQLGYTFAPEYSAPRQLVFLRPAKAGVPSTFSD